jgi:hypothetical protein
MQSDRISWDIVWVMECLMVPKDLTNQKFGKLFIIKKIGRKNKKGIYWQCVCDCGAIKEVRTDHLTSYRILSCGCINRDNFVKDITGKKFGKLTAIEYISYSNRSNKKSVYWRCICVCGSEHIVRRDHLIRLETISCGCEHRHTISEDAQLTSAKEAHRHNYADGDIDFAHFYMLSKQNCHYCCAPPANKINAFLSKPNASDFSKQNGYFIYNGLDRIDSNLPHNKSNCVPCCKYCNYLKSDLTLEQFKQLIITIYNHCVVSKFDHKCFNFNSYKRLQMSEQSYNKWIKDLYNNFIVLMDGQIKL